MLTLHTNLLVGETGRKATTQLSPDFNSYCMFNGYALGCADDKVCELSGSTYSGEDIDARVKLFNTKFSNQGSEQVRFVYLSLEASAPIQLLVYVEDVLSQTIDVPATAGRQYVRVEPGRGLQGQYWSMEIRNVDGSWFSIDEVEALVVFHKH